MATRTKTANSGSGLFAVAFVLILVLATGYGLVLCADNLTKNHADIKHGQDALAVRAWIAGHGDYCRWECPDGRTRFVCDMGRGKWAIQVLEDDIEVTAFICSSQGCALSIIEGCTNPWHMAHP